VRAVQLFSAAEAQAASASKDGIEFAPNLTVHAIFEFALACQG